MWICHDCLELSRIQQEKKTEKKKNIPPSSSFINQNDNNQHDNIGIASKSDVSPNMPRADEMEH